MYLLDTVVQSELRMRRRDPGLERWFRSVTAPDLFLSTITIGEVELGIEKRRPRDPASAGELDRRLELTLRAYRDRILPLDIGSARRWGRMAARIGSRGLDLAIAATALEHGLAVVTRNISHFEPTGVETLNPWSA